MRKFSLVVLVFYGSPGLASTASGTVTTLYARAYDNLHIVRVDGAPTTRPPCAASSDYYMIKDENSRAGQTQIAAILSAQVSGRRIQIQGAGTCVRWPDGEDIEYVNVLP